MSEPDWAELVEQRRADAELDREWWLDRAEGAYLLGLSGGPP